jgi:hypothetical protein
VKTRLAVVALAVTLPALLSACQPAQTGAAALVGTHRLSEVKLQADVKDTVTAIGPAPSADANTGQILDATIERFIRHQLIVEAAAANKISITQAQIDALIDSALTGGRTRADLEQLVAQQASVPPSELDSYAADALLQSKIESTLAPEGSADQQSGALLTALQAVAKKVQISVSPRYGSFDFGTLSVVAAANDLSQPAGNSAAPGASTLLPSSSP